MPIINLFILLAKLVSSITVPDLTPESFPYPFSRKYSPGQKNIKILGKVNPTGIEYTIEQLFTGLPDFKCYKNNDTIEMDRKSYYSITMDPSARVFEYMILELFKFNIRATKVEHDVDTATCFYYDAMGSNIGGCFEKLELKWYEIFAQFHHYVGGQDFHNNHIQRSPFPGSSTIYGFQIFDYYKYKYYKDLNKIVSSANNEKPLPALNFHDRMAELDKFINKMPDTGNTKRLKIYLTTCVKWYHGFKISKLSPTKEYRVRWKNHVEWILGSPILLAAPVVKKNILIEKKKVITEEITVTDKTVTFLHAPEKYMMLNIKDEKLIKQEHFPEINGKKKKSKLKLVNDCQCGSKCEFEFKNGEDVGDLRKGKSIMAHEFKRYETNHEWCLVGKSKKTTFISPKSESLDFKNRFITLQNLCDVSLDDATMPAHIAPYMEDSVVDPMPYTGQQIAALATKKERREATLKLNEWKQKNKDKGKKTTSKKSKNISNFEKNRKIEIAEEHKLKKLTKNRIENKKICRKVTYQKGEVKLLDYLKYKIASLTGRVLESSSIEDILNKTVDKKTLKISRKIKRIIFNEFNYK